LKKIKILGIITTLVLVMGIIFTGCNKKEIEVIDDKTDGVRIAEVIKAAKDSIKETKVEETTTEAVEETSAEAVEVVSDNYVAEENTYVEPTLPAYSYYVNGVPMIYQNAEGLPAGCEGTSLTMALQYVGIPVSAWDTCMNYMPWSYDSCDIENVFIGNPSGGGYGCYVGCVMTTANNIISAYGAGVSAHNLTGDLNGMYNTIMSGYPVVIWGTDGWGDPNWGTYYSNAGAFTWWSNEHCLLLVGFTDTTVTIHDPYRGVVEIDRAWFEYEWANCGSKAVAVY